MKPFDLILAAAEKIGWAELIARLGITRQTVWHWKRSSRTPNAAHVLAAQAVLAEAELDL